MALIILPTAAEEDGVDLAQAKLRAAIDDPFTVVMIVYGPTPDVNRALEVCSARATTQAESRRVVWCPDSTVLSPTQRRAFFRASKMAVCVGLEDRISSALTRDQVGSRLAVEEAFLKGEAQET